MSYENFRVKLEKSLTKLGIINYQNEVISKIERIHSLNVLYDFSEGQINEFLEFLITFGIKQYIRDQGFLLNEIENEYIDEIKLVSLLLHMNLVTVDDWYKFKVARFSVLGNEVVNILIESLTKELNNKHYFDDLHPFGLWVFNNLTPNGGAIDCDFKANFQYTDMMFPVTLPSQENFELFIKEFDTWQKYLKICIDKFVSNKLVYTSKSYVSTNGGELRDDRYCIHPKIANFISFIINTRLKDYKSYFDIEIKKLDSMFFGLQFFDRQLFQYKNWAIGVIDFETIVGELNNNYYKYKNDILKVLEKLKDFCFVEQISQNTFPKKISIKSPKKFLDTYNDLVKECLSSFSQLPDIIKVGLVPKEISTSIKTVNNMIQASEGMTTNARQNIDIARNVYVVYGRNTRIRDEMIHFLQSLDLHPIDWSEAIMDTEKATPYIGEVIDAAFTKATAIIILFTPDEEVKLKSQFVKNNDPIYEKEVSFQPRPNVLFEAGLAFSKNPRGTIIVQIGLIRPISDISGLHIVKFDGLKNSTNEDSRNQLVQRLKTAGCTIDLKDIRWLREGDFSLEDDIANKQI